jgi:hypothetical protein
MCVAGRWNISHPAVLQCGVMQKAIVLNGNKESIYDFLAQSNIPWTFCDILSICSGDEIRLNEKLHFPTISIVGSMKRISLTLKFSFRKGRNAYIG